MKRFKLKPLVGLLGLVFILNSCSDSEDDPDPCINGPEISVDEIKVSRIIKSQYLENKVLFPPIIPPVIKMFTYK